MAKYGAWIVGVLIISVLAFALWYQRQYPREIISTSTIRVVSASRPGPPMSLQTRVVKIANTRFEEVRMPNGTWIGCAGDCRRAALDAGPDFWDAQARDKR